MRASLGMLVAVSLMLLIKCVEISGHGYLIEPVARSSAWRKDSRRFPGYYEDNQMNCGGFGSQWSKNGGKCGICGEDYSQTKRFEKGGDLYRGHIVETYTVGQEITTQVMITANHKGYFEFRVCSVDDSAQGDATQACLDQTILKDKFGRTQIPLNSDKDGIYQAHLVLPSGFSCKHCVFQWKYNAGNSWGTNPVTGLSGMGLGAQEQFLGCSDIQIVGRNKYQREWNSPQDADVVLPPRSEYPIFKEFEKKQVGSDETVVSKTLLANMLREIKRMKENERQQNYKQAREAALLQQEREQVERAANFESDNMEEREASYSDLSERSLIPVRGQQQQQLASPSVVELSDRAVADADAVERDDTASDLNGAGQPSQNFAHNPPNPVRREYRRKLINSLKSLFQ